MVNRKIVICSESLRLPRVATSPDEKFSIDSEAIIGLLKNNIEALQAGSIGIEAAGFGGKDEFMKEVPFFVLSKFAEYRHRNQAIEIFIIAVRDADTSDGKKISGIRRKLADKIRKLIGAQEFNRVHIMFAVQAIEAWILADEQKLNEYLGVTNKVKHINEPEKSSIPNKSCRIFSCNVAENIRRNSCKICCLSFRFPNSGAASISMSFTPVCKRSWKEQRHHHHNHTRNPNFTPSNEVHSDRNIWPPRRSSTRLIMTPSVPLAIVSGLPLRRAYEKLVSILIGWRGSISNLAPISGPQNSRPKPLLLT